MPAKAEVKSAELEETQELAAPQQSKVASLKNFAAANSKLVGATILATAAISAFAVAYKKNQAEDETEEV